MKIGKLRHRLVIKSFTEASDGEGGTERSYSTQATVWGRVKPLKGRELMHARQVNDLVTHEITIRGGTTITPDQRIEHRGRTFEILTVIDGDDERRIEQKILAEERVA